MKHLRVFLLMALFLLGFSYVVKAQNKKVAIYVEKESGLDDDEQAALNWFRKKYPDGIVYLPNTISSVNLSSVNTLWIPIDRVGIAQGWRNLPDCFKNDVTINALKAFVKDGGNLLLTNHATQLIVPIGRVADNYAPGIFGSGNGGNNDDAWGINANIGLGRADHRGDDIYKGLATSEFTLQDPHHEIFPMIGAGYKEDHNCMWDFNGMGLDVFGFQDKTKSTVLGTWQQVVDLVCAGFIEFQPYREYKGHILANGLACYEWNQNNKTNDYQSNIELLTSNSLEHLLNAVPGQGVQPVKPGKVMGLDMTLVGSNQLTEEKTGNTITVSQATSPANGVGAKGSALHFDGYSTTVDCSVDADALSPEALTFAVWAAPETYPMMADDGGGDGNWYSTIASDIDGNSGFGFEVSNKGNYRFRCAIGGQMIEIAAPDKLPCYEWSHLVAVMDAANGKVTFYRNGQEIGSKSCGSSIDAGNGNFQIGRNRNGVSMDKWRLDIFNGLIDDVELYNGVADASVINATADNGAPDFNYDPSHYANSLFRPAFHGMPAANWTNETHGAMYYNGKFHVFFQKNGNGGYLSHQRWGHIISDNLYKWKETKVALTPGEYYDLKGCWSGCLFTNPDFNDGKPTVFYPGVDYAKARIVMASPLDDDLLDWKKDGVVIDGKPDGLSDDFRDPYFFTQNGNDYLIVGTGKNGIGATTLHRYNKATKTWSNDGSTFFEGTSRDLDGTFWEMPNITKFGDKWVFTCTPQGTGQGVLTTYWIGDIDNNGKFHPTSGANPKYLELPGTSKEGFGLLSPNFFTYDNKTLILGIVPDKGMDDYHEGWSHTYSLPREVTLAPDGNSIYQKPYTGLQAMRTGTKYEKSSYNLNGTESLNPVSGRQFEICGEFTVGNSEFGYRFYGDGNNGAKLYYNPNDNKITLDLNGMARVANDQGVFNGIYSSTLPENIAKGSKMKIQLFVDHCIADIFVNDKWAFSVRIYPTDRNADKVSVFANGNTQVVSLNAWTLDPNLGGTATGIDQIEANGNAKLSGAVYNLAGQRVGADYKGIVIRNGKKFVQK